MRDKGCRFHFAFIGVFDANGGDLAIVMVPAIRCCLYKMIRSAEEAAFAFLFSVSLVSGWFLKFMICVSRRKSPFGKGHFPFTSIQKEEESYVNGSEKG